MVLSSLLCLTFLFLLLLPIAFCKVPHPPGGSKKRTVNRPLCQSLHAALRPGGTGTKEKQAFASYHFEVDNEALIMALDSSSSELEELDPENEKNCCSSVKDPLRKFYTHSMSICRTHHMRECTTVCACVLA